jgi:ABC-type Zn uptake system ZnuABC Zn-binding protein ZnuA
MVPNKLSGSVDFENFNGKRVAFLWIVLFLAAIPITLSSESPEKVRVLATNTIIADITYQLAGDKVRISSLVPVGMDPHNFDPSPSDIVLVSGSDLILINGMNLETWIIGLIHRSETRARVDTVTKGIDPIYTGKYESVVDPHAWLDPVLGKTYARNIAESLIRLLPDAKEIIEFNLAVLLDELDAVHNYTVEKMESIPEEQRILVTSHDAFRYFGNRYQMRVEAVFPGSAEAEITIRDMAELSKTINNTRVKAIFPESTINPRLVQQIAGDNEIKVGGKLYTDSLSDKEGVADNYISLLYHNTNTIFRGLKGEKDEVDSSASDVPVFLTISILAVLAGSFFIMWYKMDLVHGR